jgi:hypothetical protein
MNAQQYDTTSQLFGFSYNQSEENRMKRAIKDAEAFMQNYGHGRRAGHVVADVEKYNGYGYVGTLDEILQRHGKLSDTDTADATDDG